MVTQTLKHSLGTGIFALMLLIAHLPASAAPLKIENPENSQAGSNQFTEISTTNAPPEILAKHIFATNDVHEPYFPTGFNIRQDPQSGNMPEAWFGNTNGLSLAGLISERLYNLDIGILEAELQANDIMCRRQSAQLHAGIDVFLKDLQPAAPKTNELDAIMQHVGKTIAEQNSPSSQNKVQGWQSAIVCLLMVAMVFIVAIARR
jgi:hypothetical protein